MGGGYAVIGRVFDRVCIEVGFYINPLIAPRVKLANTMSIISNH